MQGVDGSNKQGQTEQERLAWYKLVYSQVEQQINAGRCVSLLLQIM